MTRNTFTLTDITHDSAGQNTAFLLVNLPAHDLATEDVEEQVEIEKLPTNRRR